MRQLTASQKIAVLEHRIARLEKQAFFNYIKGKIKTLVLRLRPLKEASSAVSQSGIPAKKALRDYRKLSKTKAYRQLEKSIKGKKPEVQIKFLSEVLKNRDNPTVLDSKYGLKLLSGKKASITIALGIATPYETALLFGSLVVSLLIAVSAKYIAEKLDVIRSSIKSKVDERVKKKDRGVSDFLYVLMYSHLDIIVAVLYYPTKAISLLTDLLIRLISGGI